MLKLQLTTSPEGKSMYPGSIMKSLKQNNTVDNQMWIKLFPVPQQ